MATQADVARHLDLSQQAISKLKNAGVITAPAGRNGYDLDACRIAYVRHLRNSAAGRDSARVGSLEAERARLAAAQAEAQERKNRRDRGELGSVAEMRDAGAGVIVMIVAQLQRVGARVAQGDAKLRKRIEMEIDEVLTDLSMTRIEDSLATPLGDHADAPDA